MSTPESLSDQGLQEALVREQTLFTNLQTLATERGLAWVGDKTARQVSGLGTLAYAGYCFMSHAINAAGEEMMKSSEGQIVTVTHIVDSKTFNQELDAALSAWSTINEETDNRAFDFIDTTAETHTDLDFVLVATPNLILSPQQLIEVAKIFGKNQPTPTHVVDEKDYGDGARPFFTQYSADELSGPLLADGEERFSKVRFSMVPAGSYAEEMLNQAEKQALLQELRDTFPESRLHVPSVLTNLTRWFTLRTKAGGTSLLGNNLISETDVDHFDLRAKQYDVDTSVPTTYISNEAPTIDNEVCQANLSAGRIDDGTRTVIALSQ